MILKKNSWNDKLSLKPTIKEQKHSFNSSNVYVCDFFSKIKKRPIRLLFIYFIFYSFNIIIPTPYRNFLESNEEESVTGRREREKVEVELLDVSYMQMQKGFDKPPWNASERFFLSPNTRFPHHLFLSASSSFSHSCININASCVPLSLSSSSSLNYFLFRSVSSEVQSFFFIFVLRNGGTLANFERAAS